MAPTTEYEPASYWDEKARRALDDPNLASCSGDPHENACMHRAQLHALDQAFDFIRRDTTVSGSRLLDFGCGAGRWFPYFRSLGVHYAGVDISREMIRICRQNHPDGRWAALESPALPFEDASFDFAFSLAVVHHNPLEAQEAMLDELVRVMKPGGMLFLFEAIGRTHNARVFPRSPEGWRSAMRARGCTLLTRRRYDYFVVSDLARRVVWKLRLPWLRDGKRARSLLRFDARVSPVLSPWISTGSDVRGAMLFRRDDR